jgi:hypothetical protein
MVVFVSIWILFALAVASIWLFPNSKVSDNEHDLKH